MFSWSFYIFPQRGGTDATLRAARDCKIFRSAFAHIDIPENLPNPAPDIHVYAGNNAAYMLSLRDIILLLKNLGFEKTELVDSRRLLNEGFLRSARSGIDEGDDQTEFMHMFGKIMPISIAVLTITIVISHFFLSSIAHHI